MPAVALAAAGALFLRGLDEVTAQQGTLDAAQLVADSLGVSLGVFLFALAAGAVLLARLLPARPPAVHLVDFAVHRAPDEWRLPRDGLVKVSEGVFAPEDIEFQHKVIHRSGLGDETCVTPAIVQRITGMSVAREEFEQICFSAVQDLLSKTGVDPKRIRFVVTNSSLFNPTPSLSAMIMNKFKMGPKTQNFALGGMGCSAGVIALDLAKQLLEHNPGEYCLVVSHENITNAHYKGRDRAMQVRGDRRGAGRPHTGVRGSRAMCGMRLLLCC
ncbi:3-ketoacyl-CoA synthase 17 [Monoraphidium neglectum]|uniref:3-ketoacyl-CoA synthase 17 n=1 Tax=Monoraphidium neglectum TaxID=145388 RepID=A0A0D2MJS9_9CHLO|nr:3-ketoacyl-CoA synthase 17 [Monoraphidium neglectum]KIZ00887.1 3-ketoacyl-CoA synthase 17 [Monoraphidium neglectum]|eukprot:XP_013899906.1 3-ketoacyl-CoA synthase 17 [Monoraphidium neglectum]